MARLSITEAIKQSPIGRTRMYSHYIKTGLITVSVDGKGDKYIDSSELLRVFGDIGKPEHSRGTFTLHAFIGRNQITLGQYNLTASIID